MSYSLMTFYSTFLIWQYYRLGSNSTQNFEYFGHVVWSKTCTDFNLRKPCYHYLNLIFHFLCLKTEKFAWNMPVRVYLIFSLNSCHQLPVAYTKFGCYRVYSDVSHALNQNRLFISCAFWRKMSWILSLTVIMELSKKHLLLIYMGVHLLLGVYWTVQV